MNLDLVTLASYLNRLPMVRWDRLTDNRFQLLSGDHRAIVVFGWIERDDDHADFVRVEFASWADSPGVGTSSAEWSPKLPAMLYGAPPSLVHAECQRVEDVFGDLVNSKIELHSTRQQ